MKSYPHTIRSVVLVGFVACACGIVSGGERRAGYFRLHPDAGPNAMAHVAAKLPDLEPTDDIDLVPKPDPGPANALQPFEVRPPRPTPIDDEDERDFRGEKTFASFLRSVIEIYDDLPEELREPQHEPVAAARQEVVDAYCPAWCQHCPAWKEMMHENPYIKFNFIKGQMPYPGEWAYPGVHYKPTGAYFVGKNISDLGTLIDSINRSREKMGLTAIATDAETVTVGSIPDDLTAWLDCKDSGSWRFKNRAESFEHRGFIVTIPANLVIRGSADGGYSRIDFIGPKPTIKVNGFWHMKRNINAIISTDDAISLKLNWFQSLRWEKRSK